MKQKLALLGCGYLNEIVAQAWKDGYLPDYELVGVFSRTKAKTEIFAGKYHCTPCHSLQELLALAPDVIAESAGVQAIYDYCSAILENGTSIVVLSIGAFADEEFYEKMKNVARENKQKIYIASGAVGGFDILRTTALMSPATVSITSRKSINSLRQSPLYSSALENVEGKAVVFAGTTKQAIDLLPTHMNVAVATALASAGPSNTKIEITAENDFVGDEYVITTQGEEIKASLKIFSRTSKIAAWSVVAVLQNITSPIVF